MDPMLPPWTVKQAGGGYRLDAHDFEGLTKEDERYERVDPTPLATLG